MVPFVAAGLALLLFAVFHPGVREAREKQERSRHPTGDTAGTAVVDLDTVRRKRA